MNLFNKTKTDKVEVVKHQEQRKETKFDVRVKPKKGQKPFECNLIERTIELAQFDKIPDAKYIENINGGTQINRLRITKKENCIYIFALNKKNVIRILQRDFNHRLPKA